MAAGYGRPLTMDETQSFILPRRSSASYSAVASRVSTQRCSSALIFNRLHLVFAVHSDKSDEYEVLRPRTYFLSGGNSVRGCARVLRP